MRVNNFPNNSNTGLPPSVNNEFCISIVDMYNIMRSVLLSGKLGHMWQRPLFLLISAGTLAKRFFVETFITEWVPLWSTVKKYIFYSEENKRYGHTAHTFSRLMSHVLI